MVQNHLPTCSGWLLSTRDVWEVVAVCTGCAAGCKGWNDGQGPHHPLTPQPRQQEQSAQEYLSLQPFASVVGPTGPDLPPEAWCPPEKTGPTVGRKACAPQPFASAGLSTLAVRAAEAWLVSLGLLPSSLDMLSQWQKQNFKPVAQAQRNTQAV